MISKIEVEEMDEDVRAVIKDLRGLRVMTTDIDPLSHYKALSSKLKFSEYEELMKIRDEGTNVRIMIKEANDKINELLLLIGGEDDFVLISFVGNIDINKIAQLSGTIDINGIEYLDNIGGGDKN